MPRLNARAFKLLEAEIKQLSRQDPVKEITAPLVLKRLVKLQDQPGTPLTATELEGLILDLLPEFNPQVIQAATKVNRGGGNKSLIGIGIGLLLMGGSTAAALVYVANLPYPPIRYPVARYAPLLLLPSFAQMDAGYRGAIAAVEQTDQLINQATSAADLELGSQKLEEGQKHLDRLPVWFLGYYPQRYCTWMSCSWQFTLDEFQQARQQIARLQAKVFQEQNAQTLLTEAQQTIQTAKQQYITDNTIEAKQAAIANWQAGMDQLTQIPPNTLASRQSQPQLDAYQRDFEQVTRLVAGSDRTNTLIQAAQQFAIRAAQLSQKPPHPSPTWEQVMNLWEQAIDQLQQIPATDPGYLQAVERLAEYKRNLGIIQTRLQAETESQRALNQAKEEIAQWQSLAASDRNQALLASQLQRIINLLEQVKPGTTANAEAQELLKLARSRQQKL